MLNFGSAIQLIWLVPTVAEPGDRLGERQGGALRISEEGSVAQADHDRGVQLSFPASWLVCSSQQYDDATPPECQAAGRPHNRVVLIMRSDTARGSRVPVHVHQRADEIFLLLNGALTVRAGDQRRELSDGGVAFLPKGDPHTGDGCRLNHTAELTPRADADQALIGRTGELGPDGGTYIRMPGMCRTGIRSRTLRPTTPSRWLGRPRARG